MWLLVLFVMATNSGGVHSNVQILRFPDQKTCGIAASVLGKLSMTAPNGSELVTTAKCILGPSRS